MKTDKRAAAKRRREPVHVLVIEHKYGNDIYVCRTRSIADRELDRYIKRWWEQEMEGPMPESPAERKEQYFSEMGDRGEEFYTIQRVQIVEKMKSG